MHWKGFGKKELWPNQGTVRYFSGRFDKSNDNLNQDRWPEGQNSNLVHPEYETEVLTTTRTRSGFAASGKDGEGEG